MASILVIQGADKGRSFELAEGENIIGREGERIRLTDTTVSRRHARLLDRDGEWQLEDLGSANGTFLNGVRLVQTTAVHRGDQIRCGSTLLVFGGGAAALRASVDLDEAGQLVDAAIVASVPSNEDSVIIPTPEAGAQAIGNLRFLYELTAEMGSLFHADLILQRALDKIFEVVRADHGFILLIDERGNLVPKASRGVDEGAGRKIPVSRTIINEVVSKQVGILSSNAMSDKRFTAGKSVHDFGIRSAICVPIKGRDRILGVIHVDCSVSEQTYSTEQLRLLTAIGFQTGLAVENVRLHESAVQAERLAAVGETVATLSHHIKNILQALGGGADLVEGGLKEGNLERSRTAWPIVQRNLDRINALILNMLAFSKDRQPLLENLNVNRVLTDCIELLTPRADERGVAVISDLDDLPAIPCDAAGLHQACMNLLSNALDAVADQTGVVTVSSEYDSMNRTVVVRVADNGSGIPPDQLPSIFQAFWSTKGQKGTGLGLAVAQKILREHRGEIRVESKVGEGTVFIVLLPALQKGDLSETAGPVGT